MTVKTKIISLKIGTAEWLRMFVCNYDVTHGIEQSPDTRGGVQCGDVLITYQMIWWDVRTSVDWLHVYVSLNFSIPLQSALREKKKKRHKSYI